MRVAVKFDDESALRATEVSDVISDSVLSAKFESIEPPIPQTRPENLFRRGRFAAHVAGELELLRIDSVLATMHRGSIAFSVLGPSPCLSPKYGGEGEGSFAS
jgi:hypothetical protein